MVSTSMAKTERVALLSRMSDSVAVLTSIPLTPLVEPLYSELPCRRTRAKAAACLAFARKEKTKSDLRPLVLPVRMLSCCVFDRDEGLTPESGAHWGSHQETSQGERPAGSDDSPLLEPPPPPPLLEPLLPPHVSKASALAYVCPYAVSSVAKVSVPAPVTQLTLSTLQVTCGEAM